MKKVDEYIKANINNFLIKTGVLGSDISNAEKALCFEFDKDYLYFLTNYGLISYESMEIKGLGVGNSSFFNAVSLTLDIKKQWDSFPINTVVLEEIGENNYVVYTMDKGVYQFSPQSLELIKATLEEYLLMRFFEVS